ncbi:FadR/GntR family transcriptional regulator [Nosocomiicoccus ampullae]|uniref:GntR family transcriptional repressor for pyruvate dehydrogenase complex n=1 Tax=Nosocomiicoccus ampullae TaxID=489910 RepID=A0A9Q2HEY2_9STAP|nr:GntR family transcriptional regulator [Nosocomiicoccus ampullae]MBB5175286.1 GntR family transcriptional repressor for pyruvate dehydrogenase complex [Nosocomiicoccus ampullae]QYA46339.1 GntR family transcriptional regulator [Nosocomiicoccus ampullae]
MNNKTRFEYILIELEKIIRENNIKPGDRLPSERYLKDKLNVSRQSVREALRALEMLGVVHVKIGEGTYLADFKDHRLFDIIGQFLIKTDEQREELKEINRVFEDYVKREYHGNKNVQEQDNKILRAIYTIIKKYTD